MTSGQVFCIFMIGTGVILLIIVLLSLAKRRMTEPFCLAWGLFALLLLLAGCLLHPTELDRYISVTGMLLILFLIYSILVSAYALSRALSVLIRQNRELAVQVSILNAETERMERELDALAEKTCKAKEDETKEDKTKDDGIKEDEIQNDEIKEDETKEDETKDNVMKADGS